MRSETRTTFQIEADRARSETTIGLQWVGGQVFELELVIAPGLEVVSVGPPEVVESSHLSYDPAGDDTKGSQQGSGRIKVRLTPGGRKDNKATLRLAGLQRFAAGEQVKLKLALVAPRQTSVSAGYYSLVTDRGLTVELDDAERFRRSEETGTSAWGLWGEWPAPCCARSKPRRRFGSRGTAMPSSCRSD